MTELSPSTRALMVELVKKHGVKTTQLLMSMSLSGETPSRHQIKHARQQHRDSEYNAGRIMHDTRRRPADDPKVARQVIPPAKPPRPPLTFEEKLARVAAGAAIITVRPLRRADPDYTLGGVSSGML